MKTKERLKTNKFYKFSSMGISLIVLVITIIVIIILVTAVILTLNKNNPIEEANKARYESDVANMQAIFTNTVAKVMAQNQCTIEVNAGELNSVKVVENGISSTEGRVNYKLNNPENSSNENGTIIFNTGTNNAITYYTGRKLPIYSSGETTWYVDSEGVISLKIDEQEYGKGEKVDEPVDKPVENLKEEIPIADSDSPILKSRTLSDNTDFYTDYYKEKITKIKFAILDKVPGNRVKEWDLSINKDKSIMSWIEEDGNNGYILTIAGKSKIIANSNSANMFRKFRNLKEIENIEILDTTQVIDMSHMFYDCNMLTSLNLIGFDTSNVTNFDSMFSSCYKLNQIDLSNFNTDNAIIMYQMFYDCRSLTNLNLSSFDTSNVTSMGEMFRHCEKLESLNLGNNFNTSNVKNMKCMFYDCIKLSTTINITGNVENYLCMFENAATVSPAKVIVNYTSGTSSLVDSIIATKSSTSNVVKGAQI